MRSLTRPSSSGSVQRDDRVFRLVFHYGGRARVYPTSRKGDGIRGEVDVRPSQARRAACARIYQRLLEVVREKTNNGDSRRIYANPDSPDEGFTMTPTAVFH